MKKLLNREGFVKGIISATIDRRHILRCSLLVVIISMKLHALTVQVWFQRIYGVLSVGLMVAQASRPSVAVVS